MSRYIDTKKYVITEYIDEHNYYRRYTVSFKNSGTYSIKFVPDGSLDLGPVDLELWKGNSCIAYEPSTELSTCIKADSTYEIWVHYHDDKPANNKYYLLIEEIESFHIDIYEPSNVYNSSNALSIQANQNIANDISSRYHHYKIQFDSDGEAVFNIKPLFEALDVKVYIYKENNLKISDTKHTYHMQVEKDKWYYIDVKHNGTDDELAALTKSGHDFYLLNVEKVMGSFRGTMIYCTPIQAKKVDTYPYMNETVIIDRDDAADLRDYFDAGESQFSVAIGLLTSIVTYPLGVFSIILGNVSGFATSFATEIWEKRDEYFDILATNDDGVEKWEMKIEYKYDRHGSNDGVWLLDSFVVSPK